MRHLVFITLFSGAINSVSLSLFYVALHSFLIAIPITATASLLIQNIIPLTYRFMASAFFLQHGHLLSTGVIFLKVLDKYRGATIYYLYSIRVIVQQIFWEGWWSRFFSFRAQQVSARNWNDPGLPDTLFVNWVLPEKRHQHWTLRLFKFHTEVNTTTYTTAILDVQTDTLLITMLFIPPASRMKPQPKPHTWMALVGI